MLLIPVWPRDVLKFPVFTFALLAINIIVFLVVWPRQERQAGAVTLVDLEESARRLVAVLAHPDSGISDADRHFLEAESAPDAVPFPSEELVAYFLETQKNQTMLPGIQRYEWELNYPVFESYRRTLASKKVESPLFQRWGFNPAKDWWPGIITHSFLHEGWGHLLLNLLFLWVSAAMAESILGGGVVWLFLVGGAAAALTQVLSGVPSGAVLVGASGAISSIMGFGLLALPRGQVKLFYLIVLAVIPKFGYFDCPLWIFLPIWFITQVFMSLAGVGHMTAHVGYAAHIGGFIFGGMVGFCWRVFKLPAA